MSDTFSAVNLGRLPDRLREPAQAYARLVQQIAGPDAASLAFYGLVVSGNFDPSTQPARNVLVLERVELDLLRKLGEHGSRLARSGIAAPIVMSPDYIARSLDTFPLELLEIQQQHVLLFGKDFFSNLEFADAHVRTECERELKTALLAMHEGLLAAGSRDRLLHAVAADAAEGLVRILRGMCWLKGSRQALGTGETVDQVEEAVGRKLPGVRAALDPTQRHDWGAFQLLYDDVNALGKAVDAW